MVTIIGVINLKNKLWIIFAIIIIIAFGVGIYLFNNKNNKNNNNQNNYTASKTSTNTQNSVENTNTSNTTTTNSATTNSTSDVVKQEELISSFSTKIYTKDASRQNNISITCSTLNNTIVSNGSTFSFCNTVGKATSEKGYQEADVYDKDGNKKKGLGGGNCQVSTTLYNAVLKIPSLVVTERHEHSNKVPYIATGKDAAVAYGSYDLKFRNDSGFDIKIKASNTSNSVDISLYKIY